jgi:hypothetical protein
MSPHDVDRDPQQYPRTKRYRASAQGRGGQLTTIVITERDALAVPLIIRNRCPSGDTS